MAFNWTCPHCNRPQTVTSGNESSDVLIFFTEEPCNGPLGLHGRSIVCSNPECREATVDVRLNVTGKDMNGRRRLLPNKDILVQKRLIPDSSARPQPDYIPLPLRADYIEACQIKDLSPKAAATLARRCLQGMIRDFCDIKKGRLIDEIQELQKRMDDERAPKGVSEESIEAIDHVRSIGNIGAHMEKDINLIVDVDPEEAQILIELIETLFDEWYVERDLPPEASLTLM